MWNKLRVLFFVLSGAALGVATVLLYQNYHIPQKREIPVIPPSSASEEQDQFGAILQNQEELFKNFDKAFNDDFFHHDDPFAEMRKFRERLGKQFRPNNKAFFPSPFDSWYGDKFGGGNVEEIVKREDDKFIYYDIKLNNMDGSSVKTQVENGYLTITGEVKKENNEKDGANHSFYQSSFHRMFPLPENVLSDKMTISNENGKLTLKFPKRSGSKSP